MRLLNISILGLAHVGLSLARPQTTTTPLNTTSSQASTDTASLTITTDNITYPTTSTSIHSTIVTGVKHPAKKEPSVITAITTQTFTTVQTMLTALSEYPATVTKTVFSTGTTAIKEVSSNGQVKTTQVKATSTYEVLSTVQDPHPPEETYDYPTSFPCFDPRPECCPEYSGELVCAPEGYEEPTAAPESEAAPTPTTPPKWR